MFSRKKTISLIGAMLLISGAYAYTFDTAIRELGPGKNGLQSGLEMVQLWHKLARAELSGSARKFIDFLDEAVKDFDFMQLYESQYLSGNRGGFKTVTFRGRNLNEGYKIDLVKGTYDQVNLDTFGNFGAEFGLKKVEKSIVGDRSFQGFLKSQANLKQFNHLNGSAYLVGMQKVLSPENVGTLPEGDGLYGNLKGDSRGLLNEWSRAFPAFSKTVHNYTALASLITVREHEGKKYTHMKMMGAVKMGNMKKDFPEIHEYLDDVEDIAKVNVTINNSEGHTISTFYLDSDKRMIIWTLYTRNGKLIPFDGKRRPVFAEEFSLSEIDKYTFYTVVNAKFNINGLKFNTNNIIIRGNYNKNATGAKINFHATKIPNPSVSGRFYNVIPTWLIDISIPGNIEELAGKFTTVMEKGNDGKGSRFNLGWDTTTPNKTLWSLDGSTEFIDNRFVRFALKIWSRKIRPSKDAIKELEKLAELLTAKLLEDVKKLAANG